MSTPEDYKVDRSKFPPGEWDHEPDRVDFHHAGFPCMIIRTKMGNLCGYVGVPPGHPFYGCGIYDGPDLDVHGGLTYASACAGHICHTPKPGEADNVWWFGFDTGHAGDITPAFLALEQELNIKLSFREVDTYKSLAYVKEEVEHLAEQLRNV